MVLLTLIGAGGVVGVACDDGSGGGGTAPLPTGTVPVPENDGGIPGEAGSDGGPVPSGTGVTVNVKVFAKPVVDAVVLFHDAAGAITSQHKTDASGKVTAAAAPAQVTVLAEGAALNQAMMLVTYTQVAEGDVLNVDLRPGDTSLTDVGQVSAVVPANALVDSHRMAVTHRCMNSFGPIVGTPVQVGVSEDCLGPSNALLVEGRNTSNEAIAFAWAKAVPAPGLGQTTSATLGPWSTSTLFALKATNAPTEGYTDGLVFVLADGAPFDMRSVPLGAVGVTDPSGRTFYTPPAAFGTSVQALAFTQHASGVGAVGTHGVLRREPFGTGAGTTFDLSQALPRILTATAGGSDTGFTASWTSAAPLTGSDGGRVKLQWYKQVNPDEVVFYDWTFVVPPTATSLTSPKLPADVGDISPTEEVRIKGAFVESTLLPGYKELKSLTVAPSAFAPGFDVGSPLPADGTVRFTMVGELLVGD